MDITSFKTIGFVFLAAMGYAAATIGMKLASGNWTYVALALLLLGFYAASHSEIVLMREIELGSLYLFVVAVETLVVLCYAWFIGEGLGPRDALGGFLILAGMMLITQSA